ncbi:hypothetical protein L7F22_023330 [Adiantum nelumboides]|nr:hypothetical protein [Adiantum nelumboides]
MDGLEQSRLIADKYDDPVQETKIEIWGKWSANKLNNAVNGLALELEQLALCGVNAGQQGCYLDGSVVADSRIIAEKLHELMKATTLALRYGNALLMTTTRLLEKHSLCWGDGYFNTNTIDNSLHAPACLRSDQQRRRQVLRELQAIVEGQVLAELDAALDADVTDTEWFFLVSMMNSFPIGAGTPFLAFATS